MTSDHGQEKQTRTLCRCVEPAGLAPPAGPEARAPPPSHSATQVQGVPRRPPGQAVVRTRCPMDSEGGSGFHHLGTEKPRWTGSTGGSFPVLERIGLLEELLA